MARIERRRRIRAKISGTNKIPRIAVFRSNKYLYLQAIDDENGRTIAAATNLKNKEEWLADFVIKLKNLKVKKVIFDRAGYKYHGKVKEIAQNLRKIGLEF